MKWLTGEKNTPVLATLQKICWNLHFFQQYRGVRQVNSDVELYYIVSGTGVKVDRVQMAVETQQTGCELGNKNNCSSLRDANRNGMQSVCDAVSMLSLEL
jgi:hypothetical protein